MQQTLTTYTNQPAAIAGGSQTAPKVFTRLTTDGKGMSTWVSPGAIDDLAGRFILRRMAQQTKAGIVGRSAQLVVPYYDTVAAKYAGTTQLRLTLNAPKVMPFDDVLNALLYGLNLFAGGSLAADTFLADFVKGNDLPL